MHGFSEIAGSLENKLLAIRVTQPQEGSLGGRVRSSSVLPLCFLKPPLPPRPAKCGNRVIVLACVESLLCECLPSKDSGAERPSLMSPGENFVQVKDRRNADTRRPRDPRRVLVRLFSPYPIDPSS